ncbi:hypothetical protein D3C87_87470 [compost metagenome]
MKLHLISFGFVFLFFTAAQAGWTLRGQYYGGQELDLGLYEEIREPLAQDLKDYVDKLPNLKELKITLNSPGGSYYETLEMLPTFKALKERGVRITTTVNNGDECDSMCVLLFAQGDVRRAGEVAAFMFHGISIAAISNIPERKTSDVLISVLASTPGLNKQWLKELVDLGVFYTPGMYWISGKELVDAGSGYVTETISRNYREKPYNRSYNPL